ncbi:hypothetical protein ATY76_04140 [Rhizobium sp. R339]|nr:hypothetical protein ATY76_04140 [Rhizobium sp. R339]
MIRAAVKAALPISEGYALKYFVVYALVCMVVGLVLLVVIRQIAPFNMERRDDQTAAGPSEQADDIIVRSTPEPTADQPARPPAQWELRPTSPPDADPSGVRKGGRVGTPSQ